MIFGYLKKTWYFMDILPACISVFHKRPEKGVSLPESGAMEGYELPYGC